jgi:hypothetical protein
MRQRTRPAAIRARQCGSRGGCRRSAVGGLREWVALGAAVGAAYHPPMNYTGVAPPPTSRRPARWRVLLVLYVVTEILVIAGVAGILALGWRQLAPHTGSWMAIAGAVIMVIATVLVGWRRALRYMPYLAVEPTKPRSVENVLELDDLLCMEAREIAERRGSPPGDSPGTRVGIALSGGGIRATTLGLGFLEGLDTAGHLRSAGYLSTVSGGSWAGGAYTVAAEGSAPRPGPGPMHEQAWWEDLFTRLKNKPYLGTSASDVTRFCTRVIAHLALAVLASMVFVWAGVLALAPVVWVAGVAAGVPGDRRDVAWYQNDLLPQIAYSNMRVPLSLADALAPPALVRWTVVILAIAIGLSIGVSFACRRSEAWLRRGGPHATKALRAPAIAVLQGILCMELVSALPWTGPLVGGTTAALGIVLALAFFYTGSLARANTPAKEAFYRVGGIVVVTTLVCAAALWVLKVDGCSWLGHAVAGCVTGSFDLFGPHILSVAPRSDTCQLEVALPYADSPPSAAFWIVAKLWFTALVMVVLCAAACVIGFARLLDLADSWRSRVEAGFLQGKLEPVEAEHHQGNTPPPWKPLPLLLVNAAFDARSSLLTELLSGGGMITFSPIAYGNRHVGFRKNEGGRPELTRAEQIAVSSAVVNVVFSDWMPHWLTPVFALLHLRLGRWLAAPRKSDVPSLPAWAALGRFVIELGGGRIDERGDYLQISDGGHHDNLGLLSLLERECDEIWVLDAGTGEGLGALESALRKAGVRTQVKDHARPVWVGRVERPGGKTTMVRICRLCRASLLLPEGGPLPELGKFPRDSTLNQWFTPEVSQAYRALGLRLAREMLLGRSA